MKNYVTVKKENASELLLKFIDLIYAVNDLKSFSTFQRLFIRTPIAYFNVQAGFNKKEELFAHPEFIKAIKFLQANPEVDITESLLEFINYGGLTLSCSDGFIAKLTFQSRGKPWDDNPDITTIVYEEIKKRFEVVSESKAFLDQADANTKGILTAYSENIEQLQGLSSKLLVFYSEERQKLESDFLARRTAHENEMEAKSQLIERRREEYAEQLETEKNQFEQEKRQFDDRKSTHARRQLLGRIESVLTEKSASNFSTETVEKYNSIEAALKWFSIGLFCLSGLWLSIILKFLVKDIVHYEFILLFASSLVAGSLIVIWLVKLRLNWFGTHSQTEMTNRHFIMNMLRASWVVEMFYEWRDEKGASMDQTLVERLTKGLFDTPKEYSAIEHPAEEFINSLAKIKNLKVSKDGIEIQK